MDESNATDFLFNCQNVDVEFGEGWRNIAEFEPVGDHFPVGIWFLQLLHIYGFFCIEGNLVEKGVGLAKVKLVNVS
jgi:hypothetical protein